MSAPEAFPLILGLSSARATLALAGGKGASLARLAAAGFPVPAGFHVTTAAYHRFIAENDLNDRILHAAARARADQPATLDQSSDEIRRIIAGGAIPGDIAAPIRAEYRALGEIAVAVRSSATAEDLPGMSFAGQQETYLNVRGEESVLEAVKRCWASLWTARALGYRARQGIRPEDVGLAVVVQELVPADVAGILFTANPLTGARDQAMINAAWGLGEAIVGSLVTPDTMVVDKASGAVVSQETADKGVMTVRTSAGTREEPVPPERRKQLALAAPQAAELVRYGVEIELLYGEPMDIEWAMRDGRIFVLQARPITALPQERVTLEWPLPRVQGRYARSSVIELLPDPLTPFFATLALPEWDAAMQRFAGPIGIGRSFPDPMLVTINDYAYYDFGMTGGQSARLLVSMISHVPQLYRMMISAQARWEEQRQKYGEVADRWAARNAGSVPAAELLEGAREIVRAAADHYITLQSGILPMAYMTESLFTYAYDRLARRKGDPTALTFVLGFDSAPIQAEKSLFDLSAKARARAGLAAYLTTTGSGEIAAVLSREPSPIEDVEGWREFTAGMAEHLQRFGHTIYDLDFAKGLPVDDPTPLVEAVKSFVAGHARSPYERQAAASREREQATRALLGRSKGLRLKLFRWLLRWAQRCAPLREDALADVGLGWPVLRNILREVGRRFAGAGVLAEPDGIFWLRWDEALGAARAWDAGNMAPRYAELIAGRRATWERECKATPPLGLPAKGAMRFFGMDFSRWMPGQMEQASGDAIKGTGASPGRVSGVARVLHGPADFGEMRQGDILVARITTPAWTPLFALAAGVVTDIGGPLSHSSIVAREYGIPAVLGTGAATGRIQSGRRITVDGDAGVVTLHTDRR